jgi:hypothetical protein
MPEQYRVEDVANKAHQLAELVGTEKPGMSQKTTLGSRDERKQALINYKRLSPEKRSTTRASTLEKLSLLREFDRQFLTETKIDVDLDELGVQHSNLTRVRLDISNDQGRNILVIPAFGGDKYGLLSLIRELALKGHTVSCVDYPESWNADPTEQFTKAVENAAGDETKNEMFGPHVRFFKKAIEMTDPEEVWGYSTSAGFLPKLLQGTKVELGIAIAPTSLLDQKKAALLAGFGTEVAAGGNFLPDQGVVLGPKVKRDAGFLEKRKRIIAGLLTEVCRRLPQWVQIPPETPGILLVSGTKDKATKSDQGIRELGLDDKPGVDILRVPWTHLGMLTHAKQLVANVSRLREQSTE